MEEYLIKGRTLPEAYHKALVTLEENGVIVDCPDYDQKQKEITGTIHVSEPTAENRISKLCIGGPKELRQYELEILDGILDFIIGKGDNLWNYTYHDRFAPWLNFVIEDLKRERYSRRAAIVIRDNEADSKSKHPVCLQSIQFMIRQDRLDMFVEFRSRDLPEAFFMNAFALTRLQEKVAVELEVPVGTYSDRSISLHAYEKNFEITTDWVEKHIKVRPHNELVYPYEGYYKDLMAESDEEIAEMIAAKKAQYGVK